MPPTRRPEMARHLINLIRSITNLCAVIAGLIILGLMGAMVYEVVMRYFFNAPTVWAFELSYMFMGASFALAIAYALKERAHVRMDLIYDQISPRGRAMIDFVGFGLLILPGSLWLTWRIGWYAYDAWVANEVSGKSAWNPQVWQFRTALAVGFLVLSLQLVAETILAVRLLVTGRADEGPVAERHR
jgi:TRAP-type mannitol/chloroaromatic compound transport system permease small subunit